MACSSAVSYTHLDVYKRQEEDYDKLTEGTCIQVSGYKTEWSGEVEIADGTFTFVEDAEPFVAEPLDVTE